MKNLFLTILIFTVITVNATKVYAVRPFITDDAAVVGQRLLQLETWALFDKNTGEHWIMWALGPTDKLEVSMGAVYGYVQNKNHTNFSFALPLLEVKYLLHEYQPDKLPGVALVGGTFLPMGKGEFAHTGYGFYSFLAITQCLGKDENVLIHGNIGVNYLRDKNQFISFWGLGTQIKTYKGLHFVAEIISGDPYVPETGLVYQTGFRHFISEFIQIDATIGQGLAGENKVPFWCGFGARFVMPIGRK